MKTIEQAIPKDSHWSDIYGMCSSLLCTIHCLATPFIFVASPTAEHCSQIGPLWWRTIDFLFLGISYLAISQTVRHTTSNWIPRAMYGAWALLLAVIVIDRLHLLHLPEVLVYIPAWSLVGLHFYNLRYCRCREDVCCT